MEASPLRCTTPIELRPAQLSRLLGYELPYHRRKELFGMDEPEDGGSRSRKQYYSPAQVAMYRETHEPGFSLADNPQSVPPVVVTRMTKGGTGKTSFTANGSTILASMGYRVLVIDADSQGSISELFNVDTENESLLTAMDLFLNGEPLEKVVIQPFADTSLDLVPGDQFIARYDSTVMSERGREKLIQKWFQENQRQLAAKYDIVMVDTNPASTILNYSLMMAADLIITPVFLDGISLKAIKCIINELEEIKTEYGVSVPLHFVSNGLHNGWPHTKMNDEQLRLRFKDQVFNKKIPHYVGFSKQHLPGEAALPLFLRDTASSAAWSLVEVAKELAKLLHLRGSSNLL
ncbi:ParA family protein [Vogesella sp. XCS3]|uniref:ParA family protein n=1 Tax=Vogesella sp. XCS3 TaxID=2877939 RepID=UPI001D0B79A5|nr:ParA family protein [Vogesella sp. XCS3]UDM18965.1 AAA family ATPase [Vogesella sp. XCS3]